MTAMFSFICQAAVLALAFVGTFWQASEGRAMLDRWRIQLGAHLQEDACFTGLPTSLDKSVMGKVMEVVADPIERIEFEAQRRGSRAWWLLVVASGLGLLFLVDDYFGGPCSVTAAIVALAVMFVVLVIGAWAYQKVYKGLDEALAEAATAAWRRATLAQWAVVLPESTTIALHPGCPTHDSSPAQETDATDGSGHS